MSGPTYVAATTTTAAAAVAAAVAAAAAAVNPAAISQFISQTEARERGPYTTLVARNGGFFSAALTPPGTR